MIVKAEILCATLFFPFEGKKENYPTFLPDFSQKETNWKSLKLYRIIWNWEISTGQNRKKK